MDDEPRTMAEPGTPPRAEAPVLYVEDDENDVFFMRRAFVRLGLPQPLQVATSGQEAVDYLEGFGRFADRVLYPLPCLVLLDLNLPGLSGLEVLRWIRERPEFDPLPVLILSASTQESDMTEAAALGASEYLTKPTNLSHMPELLIGVRDRWLRPQPAAGPRRAAEQTWPGSDDPWRRVQTPTPPRNEPGQGRLFGTAWPPLSTDVEP